MTHTSVHSHAQAPDRFAQIALSVAQHILAVVFGLLPIFFVPSLSAPFGYSKTLFVILGVVIALILYCFSLLRSGTIRFGAAWMPILLGAVAFIALISALLSGDFRDGLIGEVFGVHTTLFIALLALSAAAWNILGSDKIIVMRLFMLLAGSTLVLALFHVLRLIFGADAISLGFFGGNATISLIGSWNDLALFFGLAIILALVALEQLPLTTWGKSLFGLVVAASLIMLSVINFFAVWMVIALVSLVVIVYGLTNERFAAPNRLAQAKRFSGVPTIVGVCVFAISVLFILGGSLVSTYISNLTDTSYIEVRPSFAATADIVRTVYSDDALFGIGPNRFSDAWRLYKDPVLNESIFWNTDFVAGFGYVTTMFATLGILGGIAWLAFLGTFVFVGGRMLLKATSTDRTWYFIGTVSFVGGLFLWFMSIVYVPGPVLLLLAAMCTGLTGAASNALLRAPTREIYGYANRRTGFVLVVSFMAMIIVSVSSLYFVGIHYASAYAFNNSIRMINEGANIDAVEAATVRAYDLSHDDAYARRLAEYQLLRMQSLYSKAEPNDSDRAQFSDALNNGLNAANVALAGDSTEPANWTTLGSIYAALVSANVEGAYERAQEAFTHARDLDPHNPLRTLTLAQLAFAAGDQDAARTYATDAIALKSNYTDAIFFTAQLDIAAGNLESAIATTRAVTLLEAQNPVRFFQLGFLLLSNDQAPEAIGAFEQAVALNPSYANARYYLALAYDDQGRTSDAREQLLIIQETNPDNSDIKELLRRLDAGEPLIDTEASQASVPEASTVDEKNGSVTTESPSDTPLVTPVNTSNEDSSAE